MKSWRNLLQYIVLQIVRISWISNPSTVRSKIQPAVAQLKKGLRKVPCPLQRWDWIHSKRKICLMLCFAILKKIVCLWWRISWLLHISLETSSSFQLLLKILSRLSCSPAICVHKTSLGNVLKLKNHHPSFQYYLQLNNLIFLLGIFLRFHEQLSCFSASPNWSVADQFYKPYGICEGHSYQAQLKRSL